MKKTVQYIALAALTLSLAACQQDNTLQEINDPNAVKINATIGALQSRVTYGDNGATSFSNGDGIKVQNTKRTSKNEATYTYNGTTWSIQEGSLVWNSGENTNQFKAWYPATASYDSFELPTDQSDASKLAAADWMTATTVDMSKPSNCELGLTFAHKLAKVTVKISETFGSQFTSKPTLGEVKIYTHDGTKIITPMVGTSSYTAIVTPGQYNGSNKFMTLKVGGDEFTVKPTTTLTAGKHYTFTLTVGKDKATIGNVTVADWGTSQEITGGVAEEIPYLTFTVGSNQSQSLVLNVMGELDSSIEYSVNGGAWENFETNGVVDAYGMSTTDPVPFTNNLRMRGKSESGTVSTNTGFMISFVDDNTLVTCSGDIRTLVDYTNYETTSTANACFFGLFMNCSALAYASGLKLISNNNKMVESCYESMFAGCEKLTSAPELPATTLAESCYKGMFMGCTSLTSAPELPAEKLANFCYVDMFDSCKSLTSAPELPATTLAQSCYVGMFAGCSNLTTAPALPATTLANNCYTNMFVNCSKLESAPVLPAETLLTGCYWQMFNGCTNLNSVTMLAMDISAQGCLTNWLEGVADTGTFTKAAGVVIPTGPSGIPEGWTVQ